MVLKWNELQDPNIAEQCWRLASQFDSSKEWDLGRKRKVTGFIGCLEQYIQSVDWDVHFFQLIKPEVEMPYLNVFCPVVDGHYLIKLEQHYHFIL
jgi:hypothetical protein